MKAEERQQSFGQACAPSPVDRFGVWLSALQVRRRLPRLAGQRLGDFGCGFNASISRALLDTAAHLTLVDVALAADLKEHPRVSAIEAALPGALSGIPSASLDVVLLLSVVEHLWDPLATLKESRRTLRPGGTCLVNVPSWMGKRALEFSAFRLGLSPADEMNDHKTYYGVRDLWPLLVRSGFRPQDIRCFPHKLGLNTFAVCAVG